MMSVEETLKALNTSSRGIKSISADERRKNYNEIEEEEHSSTLELIISQFKSVLVAILVFAVLVSLFLGETIQAGVIIVIIILNALLGFYQERKAEKALEALKKMAAPKCIVIRDGKQQQMESRFLVPGDIIVLEAGSRVPADARVIESIEIRANESLLTGESIASGKDTEKVGDVILADRENMVYLGTNIVYGRGKAVVVETGMNTEFGKIAEKLQEPEEPTPLQRRLKQLGVHLSILIVAAMIIIFFVGMFSGIPAVEMLLVAITLAVAAIPEGLPAVVTITLAIGLTRMAKKKAIVRRLPSVETLGSSTIICSDKTGTLTKNQMTVRRIYADGHIIDVTGDGYTTKGEFTSEGRRIESMALEATLLNGILCNNARLENKTGDPTEIALLVSAYKYGIKAEGNRIKEIPFESERKMMSVFFENNSQKRLYTKGATEEVLNLCTHVYRNGKELPITDSDRREILRVNDMFAKDALRVLAFAYGLYPEEKKLVFTGLQAMIDPPRPEAKVAIEKCKTAGIRVIMITGDHKNTAAAIAEELGLGNTALTGKELDNLSDEEFEEHVEDIAVYARASPEHKVRITKALQRKGNVVAMSGDGVNDAPALKKADIGIAVGSGTDVTKEAADLVLTDDNFASIVDSVEEGRNIYDNIKKFIHYLLSANIGEVSVVFISILLRFPLPLLPLQILWMNLLTDGLPALALGVEPPEKDIMRRKPRDPHEEILNRKSLSHVVFVGAILGLITLILFVASLDQGEIHARTIAFTALVILQLLMVFNFKSSMPMYKTRLFNNRKLIAAIVVSFVLQLAVLYTPLGIIFGTVPLALGDWASIIIAGSAMLIILEIRKLKKQD